MIDKMSVTFTGMEAYNEEQELEFSIETMKSIYIRNTCFKIENNKLIETELEPQSPETLYNSIPKFVSGEIYEVILRRHDGNFSSFHVDNLEED